MDRQTTMTQIEQIKAEIERLKKDNGKDGRPSNITETLCSHLLFFIESLEKESKDNKTEAYMKGFCDGVEAEREAADVGPKIKGWVARDEDGQISLHFIKPSRTRTSTRYCRWFSMNAQAITRKSFPNLKWEDEPIEIELTINRI